MAELHPFTSFFYGAVMGIVLALSVVSAISSAYLLSSLGIGTTLVGSTVAYKVPDWIARWDPNYRLGAYDVYQVSIEDFSTGFAAGLVTTLAIVYLRKILRGE